MSTATLPPRLVLGIETSCDDTGMGLIDGDLHLVANQVASQIPDHQPYGGVVPEIASRMHLESINQLFDYTLASCNCTREQISAVAVTSRPGLIGSILVGVGFAQTITRVLGVPLFPIHHLEGHIFANFLDNPQPPEFPFLALLLSGGHSSIFLVEGFGRYQSLAVCRDDSAGEAFDKVAKMIGLPYPGGPAIEELAATGDASGLRLPHPRFKAGNQLDFSFSGLKTATKDALARGTAPADLAASFQSAVCGIVVRRIKGAMQQTGCRRVVLGGGVAANGALRGALAAVPGLELFAPPPSLCTDNGAMIAACGQLAIKALRPTCPNPLVFASQELVT